MAQEALEQISMTALLKRKKYYAMIIAPDGQRFRFDFTPVAERLGRERGEKLKRGMLENYQHGRELYEDAEREEEPPQVTTDFLGCHENSDESGKSSAMWYALQEICGAALEAVEIAIYAEGSEEQYHEAHSYINKSAKKEAEQREQRQQKERELRAYYEGYDKGRAEAFAEMREQEKKRKRKGLWW